MSQLGSKQCNEILSPAKLYYNCKYCMSNNLRGTATLVWMTRALITRSLCDHATELLMFLLNCCSFNVKKHFYHFIFRYKVPPAQITMKLEPLDKRSRTVPVMKKQNSWEKLKHAAVQIMWVSREGVECRFHGSRVELGGCRYAEDSRMSWEMGRIALRILM